MDKKRFIEALDYAGLGVENKDSLEVHRVLCEMFDVANNSELTETEIADITTILTSYFKNKTIPSFASLHPSKPVWRQFHLGMYPFGTKLRVKYGAKLEGSRKKYAGQEGTFSYVVNGEVFIDFNDNKLNRAPMFQPSDLEACM